MRVNRRKRKEEQKKVFLYGRLDFEYRAAIYCELHGCYLAPADVAEKRCNVKRCKYRKELRRKESDERDAKI